MIKKQLLTLTLAAFAVAAFVGFSATDSKAATNNPFPAAHVHYGDINNDGVVDAKDVVLLKKLMADPNPQYVRAADLNGDGLFDSGDYGILTSYIDSKYTSPIMAETIHYGDVNCDGKINVDDIIVLKQFILTHGANMKADYDYLASDVNGDGKRDQADVQMIKDYLAGKLK